MTEDEAKTKVCSGARAAGRGEDINCIASQCMEWRWKVTTPEIGQSYALDARGSAYYYPIFGRPEILDTDGGCGLAGPVT
jgi:hypothetical protein